MRCDVMRYESDERQLREKSLPSSLASNACSAFAVLLTTASPFFYNCILLYFCTSPLLFFSTSCHVGNPNQPHADLPRSSRQPPIPLPSLRNHARLPQTLRNRHSNSLTVRLPALPLPDPSAPPQPRPAVPPAADLALPHHHPVLEVLERPLRQEPQGRVSHVRCRTARALRDGHRHRPPRYAGEAATG